MSISRQNLSVIIVSFKSDKVIHDCIRSIDSEIEIIVVDNSNNKDFKETIEKKYESMLPMYESVYCRRQHRRNLDLY